MRRSSTAAASRAVECGRNPAIALASSVARAADRAGDPRLVALASPSSGRRQVLSLQTSWCITHLSTTVVLEAVKQKVAYALSAFPGMHYTVDDLIAEGDKVVHRWPFRGTHQGEFMNVPPTGKEVTTTGITIYRNVGGKIVEEWAE